MIIPSINFHFDQKAQLLKWVYLYSILVMRSEENSFNDLSTKTKVPRKQLNVCQFGKFAASASNVTIQVTVYTCG